jgi:hypothetical protein
MAVKVEFKWNRSPDAIAARIISPTVKVYAASEWHRLFTPWVPKVTGHLNSATYSAEGNAGMITHPGPYAHAHYVGRHWKTGTPFKWKNPLASAQWDQAARAAGKVPALIQSIQGYIGR